MKILLTGATGFIGNVLAKTLVDRGFDLSVVLRKKQVFCQNIKQFIVADFINNPDFKEALKNIDCVVHLAGKAHEIDKNKALVLAEFQKINTDSTLNLAKQAAEVGVKRFVFLSSIRVNGNQNNTPFLATDTPNPKEPYAISKYKAEQGLLKLAKETSLEVVSIRPSLVYGAHASGNFAKLIRWVSAKNPLPLPLGGVNNKRSFIAIDNLVDFIITCVQHEKAKNEVFLISDGQDLSTTELLRKIAHAFGKNIFLLPIPVGLMIFIAKLFNREDDSVRLFSSLQVDNSKATTLLGWRPKITIDEQLEKIARETLV